MQKRHLLRASAAAAIALSTGLAVLPAVAQDNVFKIGLVLPMTCLLYTSPSPRDRQKSRMPSSA